MLSLRNVLLVVVLNVFTGFVIAMDGQVKCAEGHFKCSNNSMCVPQEKNCDQIEDCPDGTDEQDCDDPDGHLYWDHLYRKRPAAERDDDLDQNQTCRFHYSGPCTCLGKSIFCQHKGFTSPPKNLPTEHIDLLDFTGNSFKNLTKELLYSVPVVDILVLKYCKIQYLAPEIFYRHTSTQTLYLDNNNIHQIPGGVFPFRSKLKTLVVSRNELSKVSNEAFQELSELRELDLRDNKLTELHSNCLQPLKKLNTLYLNGNRLRKFTSSEYFPPLPLIALSLADNYLETLAPSTFRQLRTLKYLYLSSNRISHLENDTFEGLHELLALNLNNNLLEHFASGVFVPVENLTSLYLKNNPFKYLAPEVLKPLKNLKHIYFSRFALCLAAPHVRSCEPHGDGISSRDHLLDNGVLRAAVWLMGVVGFAGNVLVLLGRRLLARDANALHSIYIRNLALSDLLMGLYLFIIADADRRYRGNYLYYENGWRHSAICNFCGVLSALSCLSSACILSLVTWDRLVSVTKPLTCQQPSFRSAAALLFTVWCFAAAAALAPVVGIADHYFGDEFYGNNGVCLSLHIHEPYTQGWQYSAAMFVVLNTSALIFICYAYCRMFREIKSSGVAIRSTQENQDRAVARRFGIIVLTDCLCWVPIIIVKIIALAGFQVSEAIYAWLAVLVLPINSALNPVLYTLTTTRFKQQALRFFNFDRRVKEIQHSGFDSGGTLSLGIFSLRGGSRRMISLRANQSSLTSTKNSWKRRSTPV